MTDFRDIPIGNILPQQPPFRFVDYLENYTEEVTEVSFTVREGTMLVEDGHLSAAGVMEHMAQASAARVGYVTVYILHKPVDIGFIGQIKKFVLNRLPRMGEEIRTKVFLKQEVFGISLADIEVRSGEELLASATLKTALHNDR